jgi:hypothetical protein
LLLDDENPRLPSSAYKVNIQGLSRHSSNNTHDQQRYLSIHPPPSRQTILKCVSSTNRHARLRRRSSTCTCNIKTGKIREESHVSLGKARPIIHLNIGHTVPSKIVVASFVRRATRRTKELANKIVNDYLTDIVENASLEETLAVVGSLNCVAVVVFPDAIDGVEERAAA